MRRTSVAWVLVGLVGCGAPGREMGMGDDDPSSDASNNNNQDGCTDAAKLVYVVDSNNKLSTWDGATKTFTDLGTLNCPVSSDPLGGPATPFSMGIDRNAIAWVLYSSSEVMRVDPKTLSCTPANYAVQHGLGQFGMGFSTDAVGGSTDTLYIIGGPTADPLAPTSTLASLDTATMTATRRGTVSGWPELTGTGNAELWGFFPNTTGSRIEKIDKATGAALQTFQLPASLNGQPLAWAFAFWGGDFWVFLMKNGSGPFPIPEANTTVYQFDASNGTLKGMTPAPGRTIVGAGVSTCAPTIFL